MIGVSLALPIAKTDDERNWKIDEKYPPANHVEY